MKLSRRLGIILLAIWLILQALLPLIGFSFSGLDTVLAILAIAAGVILLIGGNMSKITDNLGILLLSIWLILQGLISLLALSFPAMGTIMAILAIAAGVLLLLER
ncbi:MAG: hypothetical protein ACP5GX_06680 [Anaerolineae bacterium]